MSNHCIKAKKTNFVLDIFGTDYAVKMVYFTLTLLPKNVAYFVGANYFFICYDKDMDGSRWDFHEPLFKDKIGFILLSEHLWKMKKLEIVHVITHEIAHAWKRHDNPRAVLGNKKSTERAAKRALRGEKEADELSVKWLSKHFHKRNIIRLCKYLKKSFQKKRLQVMVS